jgi:hypothetical protein
MEIVLRVRVIFGFLLVLTALLPLPSSAKAAGCAGTRKINQPIPYPVASAAATHAQQVEEVPRTADVLLIGDSHAHLWPADLWSPLQIVNTGIAGDLIEHLLWRLDDPRWRSLQPKNVVLFVGSNNLARGDCTFAILEGVAVIQRRLKSLWPAAQLFFISIPPRATNGSVRATERKLVNLILKRGASDSNAIHVDTDNILDHLSRDQVHYIRQAYGMLTSAIRPRLQ